MCLVFCQRVLRIQPRVTVSTVTTTHPLPIATKYSIYVIRIMSNVVHSDLRILRSVLARKPGQFNSQPAKRCFSNWEISSRRLTLAMPYSITGVSSTLHSSFCTCEPRCTTLTEHRAPISLSPQKPIMQYFVIYYFNGWNDSKPREATISLCKGTTNPFTNTHSHLTHQHSLVQLEIHTEIQLQTMDWPGMDGGYGLWLLLRYITYICIYCPLLIED